mgnify:CR=1 FL=1
MKHEGFANRTGLDFRFFDYEDNSLALDVDYVNSVSVEISADPVAATGGADGAEQVVFDDKESLSKNVRKMAEKLDTYNHYLNSLSDFKTYYLNIGDGLAITVRK